MHSNISISLQLGVFSDLDSSSNATPRRKRKRQNPNSSSPHPSSFPEASTPSNLIPEPSDYSSQSSSDSDLSDVSQISSIQSINIFQSLEDAIQWTLPAMSPLRSHTPNDTLDSSIPIGKLLLHLIYTDYNTRVVQPKRTFSPRNCKTWPLFRDSKIPKISHLFTLISIPYFNPHT